MQFLIILFVVVIIGGIALIYIEKRRTHNEQRPDVKNNFNESISDIADFYQIEDIYNGAILKDDQYYMMARIEGLNFTVISVDEQNTREATLVSIFTRLDYPIRFITNTVIADTTDEARRIAEIAAKTPEGTLRLYRTMYAGALDLMRSERRVTTQETFMIIPGKTAEEVMNRLHLITSSLRQQTNIIVTPILTTDEVYDTIQGILMPDKITKPSQTAAQDVHSSIHVSTREVLNYAR